MTEPPHRFVVPLPESLDAWLAFRRGAQQTLLGLLGDLPPLFAPALSIGPAEQRDGYTFHAFTFDNGADATVTGSLLIPDGLTAPAPAILYMHAHGGKYLRGRDELFNDPPMGVSPVPALMATGSVVMAIDCYAFGERAPHGPGGPMEPGREVEVSWFKKHLWEGCTLWGMIVRDDMLALSALLAHPLVDPARVSTTGMSLGGSRATWLAALDERVAAVVPVAQMTRYRDFAAQGSYQLHSVYYYVPGALTSGLDMEILTALAAPRPQTILIGDSDPLSPVGGVRTIDAFTAHVYSLYGARDAYQTVLYEGVAHQYTPAMFEAMLAAILPAHRPSIVPRPAP